MRDQRIASTVVGVSAPERVDELIVNECAEIPAELWEQVSELLDLDTRHLSVAGDAPRRPTNDPASGRRAGPVCDDRQRLQVRVLPPVVAGPSRIASEPRASTRRRIEGSRWRSDSTLPLSARSRRRWQGDAEFAIVAVPWSVAPEITVELAELGVPVLVETPPAPDVDGMRALWSQVGHLDRVHVADQSMYMPTHQSRLAMIRAGLIGEPTSVQVSSNHLYHAVSIMRGLLGAGKGVTRSVPTTSARRCSSPSRGTGSPMNRFLRSE